MGKLKGANLWNQQLLDSLGDEVTSLCEQVFNVSRTHGESVIVPPFSRGSLVLHP